MADTNHTLKALNRLEKTIKAQRTQLLQAHGVLTCLYEVLLHADGEQAVPYAQAAYVAVECAGRDLEVSDMAKLGLDSDATATQRHGVVAKAVKEIEQDIRALSSEEKLQLLRTLLAELDAPADANVERAWLETSQRRYRELVEGKVQGVPGPLVFERLRARLNR
jgi:hypothetical protein